MVYTLPTFSEANQLVRSVRLEISIGMTIGLIGKVDYIGSRV